MIPVQGPQILNCHPCHITARCLNKSFFPLPLERLWPIMVKNLKKVQIEKSLRIHAFVLMGNHFHLLCHHPSNNTHEALEYFLDQITSDVCEQRKMNGPLWESNTSLSFIKNRTHYFQVYRYIYQNPLRAKLSLKVEDYLYSTLKGPFPFALHSNVSFAFGGEKGEFLWLNQLFAPEDEGEIRKGLCRPVFQTSTTGRTKLSSYHPAR